MENSKIVFLINDQVRAVEACYEPDGSSTVFKTFDPDIAVDDYVVVETATRHEMTVVKVTAVDVEVNLESPTRIDWIIGKVDSSHFEQTLKQEKEAITAVHSAEKARKKKELRAALFEDAQEQMEALALTNASTDEVTE